jgi:hypothetical protein
VNPQIPQTHKPQIQSLTAYHTARASLRYILPIHDFAVRDAEQLSSRRISREVALYRTLESDAFDLRPLEKTRIRVAFAFSEPAGLFGWLSGIVPF